MAQAVFALSDAQYYPAPVAFMLDDFEQVQASVFQVARAPGQKRGVSGLPVPDRRRVCHAVRPRPAPVGLAGTRRCRAPNAHATMALSSNRKLTGH